MRTSPPGRPLFPVFFSFVHEIAEFIGVCQLHRPVPDMKYANRLGRLINREVNLIAAVAFTVKEKANLRLKIL